MMTEILNFQLIDVSSLSIALIKYLLSGNGSYVYDV